MSQQHEDRFFPTREQIIAILPDMPEIHTFMQFGFTMIGASVPRDVIMRHVRSMELSGENATSMNHGLVYKNENGKFVFVETINTFTGDFTMPPEKPTIIQPAKYLRNTIAAMVKANCYCQCGLAGGAILRYKPGISWAVYRQGQRPDPNSHTDRRFKAWANELSVFRTAIAKTNQNLAAGWVQLVPHEGWYGAKLTIMPSVESLFAMTEVTK